MYRLNTKNQNNSNKYKQTLVFENILAYYFWNLETFGTKNSFAPISFQKKKNLQHKSNDPGREIGGDPTSFDIQWGLYYSIFFPFLNNHNPLFKDNGIKINTFTEFSPIHIEYAAKISFTPIAFLILDIQNKIGTGWELLDFNGLGRNIPKKEYTHPLYEDLSGVVYTSDFNITFQMDLGEIWKGKWNHLIFVINPDFQYKNYTHANNNTAWQYKNKEPIYFNGWYYKGNYFLGYKLPFKKSLFGVFIETEQFLTHKNDSPMTTGWGSDFIKAYISPLYSFDINKFTITTMLQFKRDRSFTDTTTGNRFFEYRKFKNPYYSFYRILFNSRNSN